MHLTPVPSTPAFAATHMRADMFLVMRQAQNVPVSIGYGRAHIRVSPHQSFRATHGALMVWGTVFLRHGHVLTDPLLTNPGMLPGCPAQCQA